MLFSSLKTQFSNRKETLDIEAYEAKRKSRSNLK